MARARIRLHRAPIREILNSSKLEKVLVNLAEPVTATAKNDPNPDYSETVEQSVHRSSGSGGRVSVRVSAAPYIGPAVEAKRGTLARALGAAGA